MRVRAQTQTNYDGRKTPHPSPEKAFKKTQVRFTSNARTFQFKRKCVLDGTQGRFFYEQKQKKILHGNGHKKRSSAELQPLLTLNLIL